MLPTSSTLSGSNKPARQPELGWQCDAPKKTPLSIWKHGLHTEVENSKSVRKLENHYSVSTGTLQLICLATGNTTAQQPNHRFGHHCDDYGNPTIPKLYCMSGFCCKLMTLLTSLILNWLLMIRGLRVHTHTHTRVCSRIQTFSL